LTPVAFFQKQRAADCAFIPAQDIEGLTDNERQSLQSVLPHQGAKFFDNGACTAKAEQPVTRSQ
jgi:hypothetical protein